MFGENIKIGIYIHYIYIYTYIVESTKVDNLYPNEIPVFPQNQSRPRDLIYPQTSMTHSNMVDCPTKRCTTAASFFTRPWRIRRATTPSGTYIQHDIWATNDPVSIDDW